MVASLALALAGPVAGPLSVLTQVGSAGLAALSATLAAVPGEGQMVAMLNASSSRRDYTAARF